MEEKFPPSRPKPFENIDDYILNVFQDEANELIRNISSNFNSLRSDGSYQLQASILRDLHTLKGCIQLVGYHTLKELTHHLESIFKQDNLELICTDEKVTSLLEQILQFLLDAVSQVHARKLIPVPGGFLPALKELSQNDSAQVISSDHGSPHIIASPSQSAFLKISLPTINNITHQAHALIKVHSEMVWQTKSLEDQFNALSKSFHLLEKKLTILENTIEEAGINSPTQYYESLHQFKAQEQQCYSILENLHLFMQHQEKQLNTLDNKLIQTKLVDFRTFIPRLESIIEQTAKKLNKKVALVIEQIDTKVDRSTMEKLMPAFEHLIRNAIDHGIESKAKRKARNKPETGHIYISLKRVGNQIIISLKDDGGGLDIEAITQKAIQQNLIAPNATLDKTSAIFFLLQPGFSTRQESTSISGRGIGMDVINHIAQSIGGTMTMDFEKNVFTIVQLVMPATLSQHSSMLFEINNIKYAIATNSLVGLTRTTIPSEQQLLTNMMVEYANQEFPLYQLKSQATSNQSLNKMSLVAIIRHPNTPYGLLLDNILGTKTLVVQPIPNLINELWAFQGISLLAGGEIVYCIEPTCFFGFLKQQKDHAA